MPRRKAKKDVKRTEEEEKNDDMSDKRIQREEKKEDFVDEEGIQSISLYYSFNSK